MNNNIFSMSNLSRFSELLQVVGVIGLIASLIFVGLELKQTQKIAIAGQQQSRTLLRTNQILSTYEFSPEEIGVENIVWADQSEIQRYNREQRQVYYWTVNENNFYQYTQGMMDQVIWDKEKQYIEAQWNHCHLRYVFEAQIFIEPFEDYVRSLPDLCNDENNSDGLIKGFN
jgi:hypothetical protein